jgi:hypothetical protein
MRDPSAKRALLNIAENYDQLAEQADQTRPSLLHVYADRREIDEPE